MMAKNKVAGVAGKLSEMSTADNVGSVEKGALTTIKGATNLLSNITKADRAENGRAIATISQIGGHGIDGARNAAQAEQTVKLQTESIKAATNVVKARHQRAAAAAILVNTVNKAAAAGATSFSGAVVEATTQATNVAAAAGKAYAFFA